ncbi:MAG: phosphoadenosine phosphosulfate reductase [Ignavibacteriaceae bacterium]
MAKIGLGINVLDAARQRINYTFDNFEKIYISFSGGKDSSVMVHLVMEESIKRNRKVGLLFIDLEAQYQYTIQHVKEIYDLYKDNIIPFWCSAPLSLSNAVSVYEPRWICWEPGKDWVRQPDKLSITDTALFPFYKYAMEFEEFAPLFGKWFSEGKRTACFVGIRSDESLNRYRTIKNENKVTFNGKMWTTLVDRNLYNVYPIYDWRTEDIWRYNGKYFKSYNKIYDLMNKAGISIHQARLCQPYGYDQRKGLWLFHVLEPETWAKIVSRVNGANSGAEFVQYSGNISGQIKITKPEGHTWQSFAKLILNSMPQELADHYDDKIYQFINWWISKGVWYDENGDFHDLHYAKTIPDEVSPKLEAAKKAPSWRRVCKALLRNDYWCKGLSFSQTNSHSYQRYKKLMKARKLKKGWHILWI